MWLRYKDQDNKEYRPTVGIRCTDIALGAAFYRDIQRLMAKLYTLEYDRPKIYMDLGGQNENESSLLGVHREKFDLILIPSKLDDTHNVNNLLQPAEVLKMIKHRYATKTNMLKASDLQSLSQFNIALSKTRFKPVTEQAYTMGIVGGMGPEADGYTVECVSNQIRKADLSNIRIYLMSDPRVPRTVAQKANVLKLGSYHNRLKAFLVIKEINSIIVPSNTFNAGPLLSWAQSTSGNRIHSIIDAVSHKISKELQGKKIGLLATSTTIDSGIYETKIVDAGSYPIKPAAELQKKVDAGILLMKSGDNLGARSLFNEVMIHLIEQGADVILLGCTEIPLALEGSLPVTDKLCLDSANILAESAVDQAITLHQKLLHIVGIYGEKIIEHRETLLENIHTLDPAIQTGFNEFIDVKNIQFDSPAANKIKKYNCLTEALHLITKQVTYIDNSKHALDESAIIGATSSTYTIESLAYFYESLLKQLEIANVIPADSFTHQLIRQMSPVTQKSDTVKILSSLCEKLEESFSVLRGMTATASITQESSKNIKS